MDNEQQEISPEMAAYIKEMEELKKVNPFAHDFRMFFAQYSQGVELQRRALADILDVVAQGLNTLKKEETND